jgi:two-component system, NarL family, nitrate/nitrite response regulator NarL
MVVSIVIADEHKVTRRGIKSYLAEENNYLVLGEAASGKEALELTLDLKPAILISEFKFSDILVWQILASLRANQSSTKLLVFSTQNSPMLAQHCYTLGARGYVFKGKSLEILGEAIKAVAQGDEFFDL